MPRSLRVLLGTIVILLVVGGPLAYSHYRQLHARNFRVVEPGVLYRSGQMSIAGLRRAIHDHGITTVITLRDAVFPNDPPPDLAEEEFCGAEEINYVRISPRKWRALDASVPAEHGIRQFLEVMDNKNNYPVLVHCFAGIHRTGAFCAIFRMEYQHWTNAEAIAEMRSFGYKDLEDEWDLLDYLKQYEPRWKRPPGLEDRGLLPIPPLSP
jgi:tyrosine-protein phosphatase SIW14